VIYLIGGASRSGKTSLALRLLEEKSISYLSTDVLMMGLRGVGYSEYANEQDDIAVAKHLENIMAPMIENIRYCGVPYTLEGVHIRPAFIRAMTDEAPDVVTGCVLGYPDVLLDQKLDDMHKYPSIANNWLMGENSEYQRQHLKRHIEISKMDKRDAEISGVALFNTGENYDENLDKAFDYLVGQFDESEI
jgi:2-phosphoglycerate kinase